MGPDPSAPPTQEPRPVSLSQAVAPERRPWPSVAQTALPVVLVGLAAVAPLAARAPFAGAGRLVLAAMLALTVLAAVTGHRDSSRLGLALSVTLAACALPWQVSWWPLPGAVGVAVYALSYLPGRSEAPHRRRPIPGLGRLGIGEIYAVVALVVVSATILLIFHQWAPPQLGPAAAVLASLEPAALAAVGLAFAMLNAFVEEVLFRGVILHHLTHALGAWLAVLAQALAFGMLHLDGYPYGPVGVALTFAYALLLGALRLRSGGLLAVWIAHVCADVVIFVLIAHTLM
jgi:membrane protease YdiL (CAAX protease family)